MKRQGAKGLVWDRLIARRPYPIDVAESLGPYARRFGHPRGDGLGLLDGFLRRAGARERQTLVAEARPA